ncbi:MAG: cytochrome c3 family protein [Bryobacteraceae bacterium]|nr:cytochrome c3 family protein [Bryobacteraceae bacterium]
MLFRSAIACLLLAPFAAPAADCLECHDGQPIDKAKWNASVHASLGCTGCHDESFNEYPHKKKLEKQDCTSCHTDNSGAYPMGRIEHEVKASNHARLVDENFACTNCHSPHTFVPVKKMASVSEAVRIANEACMECHAKPDEKTGDRKNAWSALSAKHTWIPRWELHTRAARCVDCHTPGKEETIHLVLSAASAQRDCVACHSKDSILLTKLYQHAAQSTTSSQGVVNAVILNNAYMIGATKNEWLDRASLIGFAAVLGGVGLHALLRRLASARRNQA